MEYAVCRRKSVTLRIGIYTRSETMAKIAVQNTNITIIAVNGDDLKNTSVK